jgi:peptidyl-prolyl cis-trans isomerase SurA
MKKFLLIFFLYLVLNNAQSIEIKIIHNIQNEIITNIDLKNEFKYLVAFNKNLKELDKEIILNISNESAIREKIKTIELSKHFKKIELKDEYVNFLFKDMFERLNLKSLIEFEVYLKDYGLTLNQVKKKITIEALWNELIVKKYASQIVINEKQLKNKIKKNSNIQSKEYKLSEILYEIDNKEDLQKKYKEIIKSVDEIGFKNSASIYSVSESSKIGGDIGWVGENSLNKKIKENIDYLKIGEISKPIILPTGILLLKMIDSKNIESNIDIKIELEKAINYERNRQLNQYSKIYYNKIKKNLEANE